MKTFRVDVMAVDVTLRVVILARQASSKGSAERQRTHVQRHSPYCIHIRSDHVRSNLSIVEAK